MRRARGTAAENVAAILFSDTVTHARWLRAQLFNEGMAPDLAEQLAEQHRKEPTRGSCREACKPVGGARLTIIQGRSRRRTDTVVARACAELAAPTRSP